MQTRRHLGCPAAFAEGKRGIVPQFRHGEAELEPGLTQDLAVLSREQAHQLVCASLDRVGDAVENLVPKAAISGPVSAGERGAGRSDG